MPGGPTDVGEAGIGAMGLGGEARADGRSDGATTGSGALVEGVARAAAGDGTTRDEGVVGAKVVANGTMPAGTALATAGGGGMVVMEATCFAKCAHWSAAHGPSKASCAASCAKCVTSSMLSGSFGNTVGGTVVSSAIGCCVAVCPTIEDLPTSITPA